MVVRNSLPFPSLVFQKGIHRANSLSHEYLWLGSDHHQRLLLGPVRSSAFRKAEASTLEPLLFPGVEQKDKATLDLGGEVGTASRTSSRWGVRNVAADVQASLVLFPWGENRTSDKAWLGLITSFL